ncbi:uncharacterized protein LOC121267122 [Juglans microcarpa x Juglans regia]|uniref:uncharacterized protein LOC121267122 n=1 Tax=Juglans microcarpa x Juglans regia TaxID=2249226 RepID=UPI001B7DFB8F|nr:uncharacterized protein LOC121267122 [Juglans microcarpa x Juglans regia]
MSHQEGLSSDPSLPVTVPSEESRPSDQEAENANNIERTRRFQFLDIYVPLYQAALKGDWHAAKAILEKYPDAIRNPITKANDTALHIATLAERASFVRELVKRMNPADLELTNRQENTAICFAAASGIVAIAEEMVNKNGKLPLIRGSNKMTPLYMAALQGRRDMVSYLYSVTDFEQLTSSERIDILVASISADFYDIALEILKKYPELATMKTSYHGMIALQELANKPFAIGSKNQLSVWERSLNYCKYFT